MIRARSSRASATIRSASLRPSSTTDSRSTTTRCDSWNAESTALVSSSISASTSPRFTTADADIGIDRAFSTTSRSSASFACTSTLSLSPATLCGHFCRTVPMATPGSDDTTTSPASHAACLTDTLGQPDEHVLGYQPGYVSPERRDLLDEARGEEGVGRACRHEHRLDVGKAGVHL